MKYLSVTVLILLSINGCKKDEILITGDISGEVRHIGFTWTVNNPKAGTKVVLYNESNPFDSTLTDDYGRYLFKDIPYGRYDVYCFREGYIRSWVHQSVFHIGGYSPTVYVDELYEIPQYQVEIDTILYNQNELTLVIPLRIDGDTILQGNNYSYMFRAFMSNSPDVSSENYTAIARGMITSWPFNSDGKVATFGRVLSYEVLNFNEVNTQPIYMVIYPIANNQGFLPADFLKESLGPPSNVVMFDWMEISGESAK